MYSIYLFIIYLALYEVFKVFSLFFDIDCEELSLKLRMKFINPQCSDDLKSKFLTCHIFDFSKNQCFLYGQFTNLSNHMKQVVNIFGKTYLFVLQKEAYQKYFVFTNVKSSLSEVFFLATYSSYIFLWMQTSNLSLISLIYLVNL